MTIKLVYIQEELDRQKFVTEAAAYFAGDPRCNTYTSGPIVAGCYFAVRWGLGNNCIVVFKLDSDIEPINYAEIIPREESKL